MTSSPPAVRQRCSEHLESGAAGERPHLENFRSQWDAEGVRVPPASAFQYSAPPPAPGFLIPFLVVVTCYCSMIKVLYCGAADCISNTRKQRVRKKCLYTLLTVCLMFAVCFVPYHIVRTVYMFVRVYMPGNCHLLNLAMITFKVWKPVVVLNCCVNPLIYFCSSQPKRLKFRAWLWRRNKRVEPTVCLVSKRCEGYNP
uniref:G-protein coupled receptors family 1 profile domain-containing protein n=1 Tax=Astatotilapia calliptera TaxID=8154 RepID=A0AAX7V251_ASTCA